MSKIEELRSKQTQQQELTAIGTLRMIEINPIEICNRSCEFCPRSMPKLYPNQNLKTSNQLIEKIAQDLQEISYTGRVGFVGFGEPTLHKGLVKQIKIISQVKTISVIEVNTNGDFLTREKVKEYADAGLTHLTVSMYDKDISKQLESLVKGTCLELVVRHCYSEKFELKIVNRNEIFTGLESKSITRNCYIPFYKMFIDWNGTVLTCSEDWGRKSDLGNVFRSSIKDIWLGKAINQYRLKLGQGARKDCDPCKSCNINGTLWGHDQHKFFDKYFKELGL